MTNENLSFRPDGTFTIAQFTDIHWNNGGDEDQRTSELMKCIMLNQNPDFVVFTGDVIHSEECVNHVESFRNAVKVVDDLGVPWTVVFGNHDAEIGITREQLMEIAKESPNCFAEAGPADIHGVGNYVVTVQSSKEQGKAAAALCHFDSGSYARFQPMGYDWIHHSQIDWYREQSMQLTQRNGGQRVPSLAFLHIPLPEYKEMWDYHTCYGDNYEGVGCPEINSGLLATMLEMGDVQGVFVGHDHINDFEGEFKGIRLCYGRAMGYSSYGKEGFPRGARIIQLQEGSQGFITWIQLDDGTIITNPKEHLAEQMRRRI
jgi:hypothetical protein